MLRSAGSPRNLLHCGRWTTSSSADCACPMQQPKAFVFRQLIFGINANPHYKSFISLCLRLGVAASRPSCGLWYVFCPSSSGNGFFAPIVPAFFSALSQVCLGARRMSSGGRRINVRGSAPAKLWDRVGICAAIAARGLARRLRRARVSALPVTQLESAPPRSFAGAFSLFFRRHS